MPDLRFSQRCIRQCRRFDRPSYLHRQSQAVVWDCCILRGTSRDLENSGEFYPKTATRRHVAAFVKSVSLSFDIKYCEPRYTCCVVSNQVPQSARCVHVSQIHNCLVYEYI